MENRAYALAAGLFTLLLGAGVVVAAMWFSGNTVETVGYVLESKFAVAGLNVQAPVRLRGVDVGKVRSIGFDAENTHLILIEVDVKAGTPITRGTVAQLGSQGVTGLAYVMLDDDGIKPEPLPPSNDKTDRIPVRQAFIDELSGSGKDLVAEIGRVARQLNVLLSEKNQTQMMRTLTQIESAATQLSALAGDGRPVLRNLPALTADARKTMQRADTLITNLDSLALQLTQRIDVLDRVAKSAGQVGAATQTVADGVVVESLPRMNALIEDLTQSSRNLNRMMIEFNARPESLLFGRPPAAPGPGEPGFNSQHGSSQK
ncbi:MAG: MlaD family protein [Burkholderiales bacterium]|nr:MlaD family protein [Burkholderiales bacterium]